MRSSFLTFALLAVIFGDALGSPIQYSRDESLEARGGYYPVFPGFGSGGDATTGSSGNVNGGSVTNNAGWGSIYNGWGSCKSSSMILSASIT